jgi:hypothetical protein
MEITTFNFLTSKAVCNSNEWKAFAKMLGISQKLSCSIDIHLRVAKPIIVENINVNLLQSDDVYSSDEWKAFAKMLGIPHKSTLSVSIHMEIDGLVTVSQTYYADRDGLNNSGLE